MPQFKVWEIELYGVDPWAEDKTEMEAPTPAKAAEQCVVKAYPPSRLVERALYPEEGRTHWTIGVETEEGEKSIFVVKSSMVVTVKATLRPDS